MNERKQGPVEILCKEIGFRFRRDMETQDVLVSFVSVLVGQIAHMRDQQERITEIPGVVAASHPKPSNDSGEVLQHVEAMLLVPGNQERMVAEAGRIHDLIHKLAPDDAYPCDHLIDMLSSCVSAIRFGLELPCMSRHAASAASHIWRHLYGVTMFDEFTPNWEKDWARAQLQDAITQLALRKQPTP